MMKTIVKTTNNQYISNFLKLFIKEKDLQKYFSYVINQPKNEKFGNYSTNLAMIMTKELKKTPIEIAEEIKEFIWKQPESKKIFKQIDVVKPGFINFYFQNKMFYDVAERILELITDYGRGNKKNIKYNLEIISANPTGFLHIGHARNGVLGDCVARILKFAGYDVVVEHYTNDAGVQIEILVLTIFIWYLNLLGIKTELPKKCYQGPRYEPVAQIIIDKYKDKFIKTKFNENQVLDPEVSELFKKEGIKYFLNKIKEHSNLLNIHIDNFISEKSFYESGKIDEMLKKLADKKYTYKKDGALWLKTTLINDDKDRVLIKNTGAYTYLVPDLASHIDKFDRTKCDMLIDFWGADHHSYVKRMKTGLKLLTDKASNFDVDIISMVKLMNDGEEVKMSKRKNNAVWVIDLYNQIGTSAIRYMLCSKLGSSPMDFDINKLQEHSDANPVFYIKYAYSRCRSILKQASNLKQFKNFLSCSLDDMPLNNHEMNLLNKFDQFPKTIEVIAKTRMPHLLCEYAFNLAKSFHSYYNDHRIIDETKEHLTCQRLKLTKATSIVFENISNLIGIDVESKI